MAYSNDVVRRARQRLESMKADRESQQQARLREVYDTLPRVREIDRQLRSSMVLAAQAAFFKGPTDTRGQLRVTKGHHLSTFPLLSIFSLLRLRPLLLWACV